MPEPRGTSTVNVPGTRKKREASGSEKAGTTEAQATKPASENLKLVWISLDGMVAQDVEKYTKKLKTPHPRGFRFVLDQGKWNKRLMVSNPTITSSSHVSTLTCATPGTHGILSNSQWNGQRKVSGFDEEFETETFAQALRKQGLRVASVGYPSLDGKTAGRSVDAGVAYDSPTNKGVVEAMAYGAVKTIQVGTRASKEVSFPIRAHLSSDGEALRLDTADGCSSSAKPGQWTNLYFDEGQKRSHAAILYVRKDGGRGHVYISPTMQNNVHPDKVRQRFDKMNLVFSAGKDFELRNAHGNEAFMRTMEHRLAFFENALRETLSSQSPDVIFAYFEDLDVLGHQFAGVDEAEPVRAAHFAKLDASLGAFLESLPASTNVVIMGDHGMSAVNYEINALKLLPASAQGKVLAMASGGALFLYASEKAGVPLSAPAPKGEAWFQETVDALRRATVSFDGGRKVFAKVVVKGSPEAKAMGLDGDKMPWLMAFALPGLGLQTRVGESELVSRRKTFVLDETKLGSAAKGDALGEPVPLGQHGHFNAAEAMRTSLVAFGPQLKSMPVSNVTRNVDVVPMVADILGLARPSGCAKDAKRDKLEAPK